MSRLLTLLLLYQNGYEVGKYISIEKQIEKTKDAYYDVLERIDYGWHEEENDSTPFIKYMLQVSTYGLPVGGSVLRNSMKKLIEEHNLPPVVFHSLRHSSVTYKLKLNGGDIKAV